MLFRHSCAHVRLIRPANYKRSQQICFFEKNLVMFTPHLDELKAAWGLPSQNKKKADTKLAVVMCCQIFDRRSTAASSGHFWLKLFMPHFCTLNKPNLQLLTDWWWSFGKNKDERLKKTDCWKMVSESRKEDWSGPQSLPKNNDKLLFLLFLIIFFQSNPRPIQPLFQQS